MVRLNLEIKADLEGVTDLKPATDDFEYFFQVQCTSCREVHPKLISLNRIEERQVSGGRHGTANLIWRCSNCKHENSAKFDTSIPVRPYTTDHSGTFSRILVVECRGLEFLRFDPRGHWTCKGTTSNMPFSDLEFEKDEWFDYDEKAALPVQITSLEIISEYVPDHVHLAEIKLRLVRFSTATRFRRETGPFGC